MTNEYGIFFNMPEDEYRAIPALNASGMKWLRVSPLDYWTRSPLNPNLADVIAEEGSTEAKDLGRAFDTRIISGKAAFDAEYAEELSPADFPNLLRTQDDLVVELRARKLAVSGTKDAQTKRLLEADPSLRARIWDCLLEDHAMVNDGKKFLTPRWMGKIATAAQMIEADPVLGQAFKGGAPRVVIVWRDEIIGVDMKMECDYLKARMITDLKTIANKNAIPILRAMKEEIPRRRYHIQAQNYLDGASHVADFIKQGRVFGDCDPAFLKALAANHEKSFGFVFQSKGVAPQAHGIVLRPGHMFLEAAKVEIEVYKQTYRTYMETLGPDLPWVTPSTFHDVDEGDVSPWALS